MTLATRLAVAMILLVALAVSAVGWLSYRNLEQALLPRVLDRIETQARLVAADLESYVGGVRGDIASFRSAAALNGFIRASLAGGTDPADGVSAATWRTRLATGFSGVLAAKPAYSKLCIIGLDVDQREIFRVDRAGTNGAIRIVPEPELRRKGEPSFFNETIQLSPGEIYVSPVIMDRGIGATETPNNPTLHVATPIFAPDGKPFGILLINVDMQPVLDRIRSSMHPGENVYVVDGRGDYLVHPDRTREFGSQLGTSADWRKDFPSLAASLGATRRVAQILPEQGAHPDGVALAPARLAGKEWVAVIERVPNAVFMAPAAAIRNTSLLVGLIAVLCAAGLAVFIARTLTRPIIQLTAAVEGAGRDGPAAIPVDAGGETGVLARAFARVMGELSAKATALEREVQDHRRTEAARDHYAARERLFSAAVESSNDAIVTKSLDGTITGWNPAAERLFGYTAAEAVGQSITLIVPPNRSEEVRDILRRISWGETIEQYETERFRKDGRTVEVSLSISPIKATSGTIIGASKTARDITASRRTRSGRSAATASASRSIVPEMTVRILLKSWATPPVSRPTISIRRAYQTCACATSAGRDFRSMLSGPGAARPFATIGDNYLN